MFSMLSSSSRLVSVLLAHSIGEASVLWPTTDARRISESSRWSLATSVTRDKHVPSSTATRSSREEEDDDDDDGDAEDAIRERVSG